MEKENVLNKINDLLFSIQVKQEKLESYNILINDKLDSIRNYKNNEIALTLYNAQRNIDKYVILSYSITAFWLKIFCIFPVSLNSLIYISEEKEVISKNFLILKASSFFFIQSPTIWYYILFYMK